MTNTQGDMKSYTWDEISQHNTSKSLWLVIENCIYDVTTYHKKHPGGAAVMLQMAAKDATAQAFAAHSKSRKPEQVMKDYCIGVVAPAAKSGGSNQESGEFSPELDKKVGHSSVGGGGTEIDDLFEGEALCGQDALVATADLLYQRLRVDKRLIRYFKGAINLRLLAEHFETFLDHAFEEFDEWPIIHPNHDMIQDAVDGLAEVLAELTQRPLPLGEDAFVQAVRLLSEEENLRDPRVATFFVKLRKGLNHRGSMPGSMAGSMDEEARMAEVEPEEEIIEKKEVKPVPTKKAAPMSIKDLMKQQRVEATGSMNGSDDEAAAADADDDLSPPAAAGAAETDGSGIDTEHFNELSLTADVIRGAQDCWHQFITRSSSREAAGEAIYSALFEGAPSLQSLFTTPRAVQAMKFMNGLHNFVTALNDPPKLKILVETLGFGHLILDVTVPRVIIFRDSILDLFMVELGEKFVAGREGWLALLNYVGGAIIYVKANYAERINTLQASWKMVTSKNDSHTKAGDTQAGDDGHTVTTQNAADMLQHQKTQNVGKKKGMLSSMFGGGKSKQAHGTMDDGVSVTTEIVKEGHTGETNVLVGSVPTTFHEMFQFNAAVMGFGTSNLWMNEVLLQFEGIVVNCANGGRLQEECEVLSLRISKCVGGQTRGVQLGEYKACMLASLRSLLPKDWSPAHEVAWTWLWENVQRQIELNMYQPPKFEKALAMLLGGLDDAAQFELRKECFAAFFMAAPAGQDYFKQSNTRLHFIAEKMLAMTIEMYRDPVKMVDDISSLGLRHVGYGIPTDLFGPFVSACVEVVMRTTDDEAAVESFRWSLGLIAKVLVRTINEGSTIVMKAINANNPKLVRKAISCAPRGDRSGWMLRVQVGTQAISPLIWAIDTGGLDAAQAMIKDLLTMRADRERYYYGMEDLFREIPDFVAKLTMDAPNLLPSLFEGLVWRSRHSKNGNRRVNYYVKYFFVDHSGAVSGAMKALVGSQDPKIMSEPVIVTVSDTMWNGLVSRQFIMRKVWFILSLVVFMFSQAILPNLRLKGDQQDIVNYCLLALRAINYLFAMVALGLRHGKLCFREYRDKDTVRVMRIFKVPRYLMDKFQFAGFVLLILLGLMMSQEPMLYCVGDASWPTEICKSAETVEGRYQVMSMAAMAVHWFLLVDMAVFSTGLSAFVLVCSHVLSEVSRFLVALSFLLMTFASAMSTLRHEHPQFRDLFNCLLTLFAITILRYEGDYREIDDEPMLLACVFAFVLASGVLLVNLLIAQINCSYEIVYQDMVGFARLNRAQCIVETLESVPRARWDRFIETLGLDTDMEFNEGDMGFSGGIKLSEAASLHPTVEDTIHRYGGSCSPEMKWPDEAADVEEDQYERLERLVHKVMKRMNAANKATARSAGPGGHSGSGSGDKGGGSGASSGSQASEAGEEEG